MATPAPITPAAVLAQNRHQGGLREYVNQRLAPYIKKALKDVCDVECATAPSHRSPPTIPLTSPKRAEYPLQWLGEHLINQSFLYENNPDATGIKERFFYIFDEPPQHDQNAARTPSAPPGEAPTEHDTANTTTDTQLPSFSDITAGEDTRQLYNGDQPISTHMGGTDEGDTRGEEMDMGQEQSNGDTNGEMLNGVTDATQEDSSTAQVNDDGEHAVDTEMAGTA